VMAPALARRPGAIRIDDPRSRILRGDALVFGEPRFFAANPPFFGDLRGGGFGGFTRSLHRRR